jgi:hypothetical protein
VTSKHLSSQVGFGPAMCIPSAARPRTGCADVAEPAGAGYRYQRITPSATAITGAETGLPVPLSEGTNLQEPIPANSRHFSTRRRSTYLRCWFEVNPEFSRGTGKSSSRLARRGNIGVWAPEERLFSWGAVRPAGPADCIKQCGVRFGRPRKLVDQVKLQSRAFKG